MLTNVSYVHTALIPVFFFYENEFHILLCVFSFVSRKKDKTCMDYHGLVHSDAKDINMQKFNSQTVHF